MSDISDHSGLPEDELLAAEYALGVLADADHAAAGQRAERDPAFARLVNEWEQRLAPWAAQIPDVAPPPQLWNSIAAAVPAQSRQQSGLWDSLNFWRGFSVAAGALAAACVAVLMYSGVFTQQKPLVASIDGGGHHHFVATIAAGGGTVAVVPAAFTADATRVPELWLIPPDGKPRPIGLLRADQPVTFTLSAELAGFAKNDAVLAVSLEPPGGSPTGLPTGPVIATGKLTSL
jgi:anti-sigma-K factor RskA